MKKIKLLFIALILVLGLTFVGCNKGGNDDQVKLDTPVVTVDDSGNASWAAIANSSGYKYVINDGTEEVTTLTKVTLKDGETIKVKAIGTKNYTDSDYSIAVTYTAKVVDTNTYGLPVPETGYYMKNADVVEDGTTRYITYVTNKTSGEENNVIAIRKGTLTEKGWLYETQKVAIEPSTDGWDQYLESASVVKGTFTYNTTSYTYLMAYAASSQKDELSNQIGLAVANDLLGEWVKVGTAPVITYDKEVYGNFIGCTSPSVVNYDKQSGIRIFYTYGDAYGLFARFFDANLSDLNNIDGVSNQITNKGNLQGGEDVLMFLNGDFAYDKTNGKFVCVKDISPVAAANPKVALSIELCEIAEKELYTTDVKVGFTSLGYYDGIDLANGSTTYERVYNASLVSDMYGYVLENLEVVYTVSLLEVETTDYLFSQHLLGFNYSK